MLYLMIVDKILDRVQVASLVLGGGGQIDDFQFFTLVRGNSGDDVGGGYR